ncbi:hypothetical protein HY837_04885, partial [archaeon]|nr:hypothetical protein [archaeon]
GFFVVLLGLERNKKREVKKYQIGVFDSEFRGFSTEPELLFRSGRVSGGPIFLWDKMYKVHFHQAQNGSNSFFYVTFESNTAITDETHLIDYYCGLYSRIFEENPELRSQFNLHESEDVQDFIKEVFGTEKAKSKIREFEEQYLRTTLVMPSGRINQQLFSKENLSNYTSTQDDLVLPNHRNRDLANTY